MYSQYVSRRMRVLWHPGSVPSTGQDRSDASAKSRAMPRASPRTAVRGSSLPVTLQSPPQQCLSPSALRQQPRNGGAQLRDAGAAVRRGGERFRKRGRMPLKSRLGGFETGGELCWLHLVGLGEHDLIAHGGGVEDFQHLVVGRREGA